MSGDEFIPEDGWINRQCERAIRDDPARIKAERDSLRATVFEKSQEIERLRADKERLQNIIDDAPHDITCALSDIRAQAKFPEDCDCFKGDAARSGKGGLTVVESQEARP
jgi:hypothetical protein